MMEDPDTAKVYSVWILARLPGQNVSLFFYSTLIIIIIASIYVVLTLCQTLFWTHKILVLLMLIIALKLVITISLLPQYYRLEL
jgi:hypothetical protein